MQENVKKCKNFLATLIKLASHNSPSPETSKNVKALVQDLLVSYVIQSSTHAVVLVHFRKFFYTVTLLSDFFLILSQMCHFNLSLYQIFQTSRWQHATLS